MKTSFWRFLLVACVGVVAFAGGCKIVEAPDVDLNRASAVLREQFCVQFDEYRTTGEFESEVVCEQFAQEIAQWLADNNISGDDIKHIFMSGGLILEGDAFEGAHSWDITSSVYIERTDIDDGPERLLRPQTVTVPEDIEGPSGYKPKFDPKGVKLVNGALRDFVDGELPILVVKMVSTDVDPDPSEADPLVFSWQACIEVQAIMQRGGGGDDDGDDDDDDDGDDDDDDHHGDDDDDHHGDDDDDHGDDDDDDSDR
jgi:hypothetical protein